MFMPGAMARNAMRPPLIADRTKAKGVCACSWMAAEQRMARARGKLRKKNEGCLTAEACTSQADRETRPQRQHDEREGAAQLRLPQARRTQPARTLRLDM